MFRQAFRLSVIAFCSFAPGGCTTHESARKPVDGNAVSFSYGEPLQEISPPDSATAGSKWLGALVTYTNSSPKPIRIAGYRKDLPFISIDTRVDENHDWVDRGLGYCGTGAEEFIIEPGDSHAFEVWLPEAYAGREYRVILHYSASPDDGRLYRATSEPHRLADPAQTPR